jgi:hypothetical protein
MKRTLAAISAMVLVASAVAWADTLVLTNGRRVQGELLGVYGREIEFEERTNFGRRMIRVPRSEIVRIEFVEEAPPPQFGGRAPGDDAAPGIPRGMRERQVNVAARDWNDTGIDVRPGQQIYFESSGEVRWGPNRRDGAAGERNSPYNAGRPLPDRPGAALIGRIGEKDVFFIGADAGPFRIRSAGRLYLGLNDDVLTDNTGALRVKVSY